VTELAGTSGVGAPPPDRVVPRRPPGAPDDGGAPGRKLPGPPSSGGPTARPRPASPPPRPTETRILGPWAFIKTYPWVFVGLIVAIGALAGGDAWLVYKRQQYEREVERLRQAMSAVERRRADYAFAANKNHYRIMIQLIRLQAEGDQALHLSVALDRGEMYLEREGIRLRAMPLRVGPDTVVGQGTNAVHVAAPRGQRTIASVGPWSITLDGGTTIYADSGIDALSGSGGVTPGNVRIPATDLQAILPNVKAGMSVYFY
jgi:hypothetical protein